MTAGAPKTGAVFNDVVAEAERSERTWASNESFDTVGHRSPFSVRCFYWSAPVYLARAQDRAAPTALLHPSRCWLRCAVSILGSNRLNFRL